MKVYFLISFLFFVGACQSNNQKRIPATMQRQVFDYSATEADYAKIVDAIISYDSAFNEIVKSKRSMAYIHLWFIKDSIYNAYDKEATHEGQRIQELLGRLGHTVQDSIGYLNQVKGRDTVFIPIEIKKKYRVANHKKPKGREPILPRYIFHLPILSHDGKNALVTLDYVCGGLCGEGYEFILEKVNGEWKVVEREYNWVA